MWQVESCLTGRFRDFIIHTGWQRALYKEVLTTFSGIPTSIGGIFLTADATLVSPEPPESSPARQLQALPTTRDYSIPASQSNPPLG